MALAMLVSFQKQNQKKNINNAFAMLMLFEDQEHQYFARRHSLRHITSNSQKAVTSGGNKRTFFESLVDTR